MTKYFTSIVPLYAAALFDYALASKKLDVIAKQVAEMKTILTQDNSLITAIAAPIYSQQEQEQLLGKLVKSIDLAKEVGNLLDILAKHKRLENLRDILEYFELLLNQHLGNKIIEITISEDLSSKQQEKIKSQLSKMFASKVAVSFKLDHKILGGVIIKTDNTMFDASVASRFAYLTEAVKNKISQLELNK